MRDQHLHEIDQRIVQGLRALGNPTRLRIVRYLGECSRCIVSEIVNQTPLAQSTVSQHLKVLREAGLIRGEIEGPAMNYCLDLRELEWLARQLQELVQSCSSTALARSCCQEDNSDTDGVHKECTGRRFRDMARNACHRPSPTS